MEALPAIKLAQMRVVLQGTAPLVVCPFWVKEEDASVVPKLLATLRQGLSLMYIKRPMCQEYAALYMKMPNRMKELSPTHFRMGFFLTGAKDEDAPVEGRPQSYTFEDTKLMPVLGKKNRRTRTVMLHGVRYEEWALRFDIEYSAVILHPTKLLEVLRRVGKQRGFGYGGAARFEVRTLT